MKKVTATDGSTQLDLLKSTSQRNRKSEAQADTVRQNPASGDTVKIGLAREIAALASPRTEKVAEIKALLAAGKYTSDSRKIAHAVISTVEEEIKFDKLTRV